MCKFFGKVILLLAIVFFCFGYSYAAPDEAVLGNSRWNVDSNGNLLPMTTNTYTIGNATYYPSEIFLGGVGKSSWGSIVSPWEESGGTTFLTSAPTGFIATHSSGQFNATQLAAGSGDILLEYGQVIDGGTNNALKFTENSDTATMTFTGDAVALSVADGGFNLTSSDATDGKMVFQPNNDVNDYIEMNTTSNQPQITFVNCPVLIESTDGAVGFGDDTVTTTGAGSFGATTVTSLIIGDEILSRGTDDIFNMSSNDEAITLRLHGDEGKNATLALTADEGDDTADTWNIQSQAENNALLIMYDTTEAINITSAGNIQAKGGDITMTGTTPTLTIGDGGAEDNAIIFNGNLTDYHIAFNEADGTLYIGLGSTVATTSVINITSAGAIATGYDITMGGTTPTLTLGATGAIVIGNDTIDRGTDNIFNISSDLSSIQVKLHADEGNNATLTLVADESDDAGDEWSIQSQTETNGLIFINEGSEIMNISKVGDILVSGTTPSITIGDAGEEDTSVVFNGIAQDFYIGLDDTADDLVVGLGTALGTTPAFAIDENQVTTFSQDPIIGGTSPLLTIGDGGDEDAGIQLNSDTTDYYIASENTLDDLQIGVGSAIGTTPAIGVDGLANVRFYQNVTVQSINYGQDGHQATDSYNITLVPAPTVLQAGLEVIFRANVSNTGACTLDIDGAGALAPVSLKVGNFTDPANDWIVHNETVKCIYDPTNVFQIINPDATP